jgi:hypothetical protein
MILTGGISQVDYNKMNINRNSPLRQGINNLLYHEAIRNLNWSRDYLWYVELDGVPNPFQRNGVIGFPAVSVTYTVNDGEIFTWHGAMEEFAAPKSKRLCDINLSFIDDEQQTLLTFFERWYNNIYNNNVGVLPLRECCKAISIYSLKSTRNKINRKIFKYDIDTGDNTNNLSNDSVMIDNGGNEIVDCREFIVFPDGPLQEQLNYSGSGAPREYTIRLVIADYVNADYGNPALHESTNSLFNTNDEGSDFLSKIADYI